MNNRIFLDLHIIQTLPPSNINRDDTGSPKTALYGGVRRARVSSQSWKRAIREYFNLNGNKHQVGVRTLDVVKFIANKIINIDNSISYDVALELANNTLNKAGISTKEYRSKALIFLGETQAESLANAAINNIDDKKELQNIFNTNPSVDIALFGRMVADDPSLNEDASCQVAHAISTHAIQNEFDFFTAIDDLTPEDNSGAGMLGNIEYNSSTLYRYANIAVHELNSQLKDNEAVINAVKLFVESFSNSLPTGKVNTFANQTLPQALIVTLRNDRPISLVTAFEKPIKSNDGNVEKSIVELAKEFEKVEKFVNKPLYSTYLTLEEVKELREIGEEKNSLKDLLDDLSEKLNECLKGE